MVHAKSLVLLALGGVLHVFGVGQLTIPAAAWFVPLLLLRYSRKVSPLAGVLGIWPVILIANSLAHSASTFVMPTGLYFSMMALETTLFVLPYLADRLITTRLPGFIATLVFPCAWVTTETINSLVNPYGTWGAIAYTQYGNLPLMQLVSVTGIAGIAFLICWFGSVFNWAWENNFNWATVKRGVLIFVSTSSLVLLGGGTRLAFAPSDIKAIRVATIGTPGHIYTTETVGRVITPIIKDPQLSAEGREKAIQTFGKIQDWYLDNARLEARAGAKIVTWPEAAVFVLDKDEAAFMERAKQLARQEKVYLLMGMATFHPGQWPLGDNKNVLVDPSGEVPFTYFKARLVPGADTDFVIPGDGSIPTADTPYGRIASVICYDMDFPEHIRQVGRAGADILLVPTGDWRSIGPTHSHMAEFRAIENGVSMVRPARWGISSAVDPCGRMLARMDEFTAEQRIMVAQVPVGRVRTLYPYIGDLFAWLCVAGLLGAIVWGRQRSRQVK